MIFNVFSNSFICLHDSLTKTTTDEQSNDQNLDSFLEPSMDLNPTEKNDTADMARSVCSVIRTRNPIDHDILLNLVSFLEATLPNCPEPTLFVPWATTFFRCVTTKSRALPSVSALYRLVTLGLRLSAACGLFASVDGGASSQAASSEDVASPRFRIMLRRYLERVSVALQGGSFADELLCAALKAVLSAPPLLLPRGVVLPALKTALKAGTSHMPTAEAALTALEDWKALDYLHQEGGIDISNQEGLDKFFPPEVWRLALRARYWAVYA